MLGRRKRQREQAAAASRMVPTALAARVLLLSLLPLLGADQMVDLSGGTGGQTSQTVYTVMGVCTVTSSRGVYDNGVKFYMENLFDGAFSTLDAHTEYWLPADPNADITLTIAFSPPLTLTRIKLAPKSRAADVAPAFSATATVGGTTASIGSTVHPLSPPVTIGQWFEYAITGGTVTEVVVSISATASTYLPFNEIQFYEECATGWSGDGCANSIVCTQPGDATGYTVTDNNLDLSAGAFDVTVGCATNYEGTAAAAACTTGFELRCGSSAVGRCPNEPARCASVQEMHEVSCCSDTRVAGWQTPAGAGNPSCLVWGERAHGGSCQDAFGDSAAAAAYCATIGGRLCTASEFEANCTRGTGCGHDTDLQWSSTPCTGAYTLSGCSSIICTQPGDITGYTVTDNNLDLSAGAFDVTVGCATNYHNAGTPSAAACTTDGVYTLSNCGETVCTAGSLPSLYSTTLSTGVLGSFSIPGYNVPTPSATTVTGLGSITCASGYVGTPVAVCIHGNDWLPLTGCSVVCTLPGDNAGSQDFETSAWGAIPGVIVQRASSQQPWTRLSGGSSSVDTSPDAALGAHGGTYYIYTEASGQFNKEFILDVMTDKNSYTFPAGLYSISFWYHMYGAETGTLSAESHKAGNATATVIWSISGQQQAAATDPWLQVTFMWTAVVNSELRIKGVTGASFHSDMCIDDFQIQGGGGAGYTVTEHEVDTIIGFNVTAACLENFQGVAPSYAAVVTPCTVSGPYQLTGCVPIVCTTPPSTGYSMREVSLNRGNPGFIVTATCAAGFSGNAVVTPCGTNGSPYILAGCSVVCTQPSDITGYSLAEDQLDKALGFNVTAACATNYAGTPVVTECYTSGSYSISGCAPIVCTQPGDITGYLPPTENQLDMAAGFNVAAASCAEHYEGMPSTTACTTSGGAYTLSGCVPIVCTQPTDITGYRVTDFELSRVEGQQRGAFVVVAKCSRYYIGTPLATPCTVSGPYTLSGCAPIACLRPLDTTGYTSTDTQLEIATGFSVAVTCAPHYEGVADVSSTGCTGTTPYMLSGCSTIECTTPRNLRGYTTPTESGLWSGNFAVSGVCATNFEGTVVATACTTDGPYTLSGCVPIICTAPADATGYTIRREKNLDLSIGLLDVTLVCSTNYRVSGSGVVTAIPCSTNGAAYVLNGCMPNTCVPPAIDSMGNITVPGYTGGDQAALLLQPALMTVPALGVVRCASSYIGTARAHCKTESDAAIQAPFSFHGCAESRCAAIALGTAVVGGYRDACSNGMQLTAHTDPSCAVRCDYGYTNAASPPGGATTVTCASTVQDGDAYGGGLLNCVEHQCAAIAFGPNVVPGDVDGCSNGQQLTTRTDDSCTVKCATGYAPQGIVTGGVDTEWLNARESPTPITCASTAANGDATTGGVVCRLIDTGVCQPGSCDCHGTSTGGQTCDLDAATDGTDACPAGCTSDPGYACVDITGDFHTCNFLCDANRFLRREDMGLLPLGDPRFGPEATFYTYAGQCMPRP